MIPYLGRPLAGSDQDLSVVTALFESTRDIKRGPMKETLKTDAQCHVRFAKELSFRAHSPERIERVISLPVHL